MAKRALLALAMAGALVTSQAQAREQIRIVGSSTVYPFVSVAAENFGRSGQWKTPVVEATGTGGGIKLFCGGLGGDLPDFANASRKIKESELALCKKNGVKEILEIKLGYDGIVLANVKGAPKYSLTLEHIFKALARKVPKDGALVNNWYKKWNEIDPALPADEINVYGPPPTSGTRDAFVEMVMEKACVKLPEFVKAYPDESKRGKVCHQLREDSRYIEAGENDNLIIQKLKSNPKALGIFGFSFLEENMDVVQASTVSGVEPSLQSISENRYPVSRSLFVYGKLGHKGLIPGLQEFAEELVSERAGGEEGYLAEKGMVPLHGNELPTVRDAVKRGQAMEF